MANKYQVGKDGIISNELWSYIEKSLKSKRTVEYLSKKTKVPVYKINNRICRKGGFELFLDRVNVNRLSSLLGIHRLTVRNWTVEGGLPYRRIHDSNKCAKYIDLKQFWEWAYEKDINLDNADLQILKAPQWAYDRKNKKVKNHCYNDNWNETEISYLKLYYRQGITLKELSKKLISIGYNRTYHACKHQIYKLSKNNELYK